MTVFTTNKEIPNHLADLPALVTPKVLAQKLGIKQQSIYQRIWRHTKNPDLNLLPQVGHFPGSRRVAFTRESVIAWWLHAQQPPIPIIKSKGVGRPTIVQQFTKARG
jgi:predicted DNA-binding transcriptional regulator AlpA